MRPGISIALALAMSIPPRPALAGGLSRDQLATLDKLIGLENLGRFEDAYNLAVQEFASSAGNASYRRSVISRGKVIALRRYDKAKDVAYLCTALEMLRVYQADLLESEEDRLDIPPELERLEVRAIEAAAPCARPSSPPQDDAAAPAPATSPGVDATSRGDAVSPGPPANAATPTTRREGPEQQPPTPLGRSRLQIAIGATLLITGAGLAAGFAGCFAARPSESEKIAALDAQATAAGRDLTSDEMLEAAAADDRYTRLSNTGKALGVFAVAAVIAGVIALSLPPRASRRVHARASGVGLRVNF